MTNMTIRPLIQNDYEPLIALIRLANKEVAQQLKLTEQNASAHTSFFTKQRLISDLNKQNELFIAEQSDKGIEGGIEVVGCVALRKADKHVWYMNRLATLPAHQNKGIGAALVRHGIEHVKTNEGTLLRIGIIEEHESLKQWYVKLGFELGAVKQFKRLPFSVLYMSYIVR